MSAGWVLDARSRRHHYAGEGTLSIKTFRGGRAMYSIGPGRVAVPEGRYFVLNEGQHYTIDVDADAPVHSMCVFFPSGFARHALPALTWRADALLDEPAREQPVAFYERTYPTIPALGRMLDRARRAVRRDALAFEEALHDLFEALAIAHGRARRDLAEAPLAAQRGTTREELYRRLWRARELLHASYAEPLELADIARVACLSPNHLLRTYRQLFGSSPGDHLRRIRIESARRMLAEGSLSVTEVAARVGYASLGSFSAVFQRITGMSPSAVRRKR